MSSVRTRAERRQAKIVRSAPSMMTAKRSFSLLSQGRLVMSQAHRRLEAATVTLPGCRRPGRGTVSRRLLASNLICLSHL